MNNFDSVVRGSLDIAQSECLVRKNTELTPDHLFLGLLKNPSSYSHKTFKKHIKDAKGVLDSLPTVGGNLSIEDVKASPKFSEWITLASGNAIESGRQEIGEKDLMKFMPKFFSSLGLDFESLKTDTEEEEEVPSFLVNLSELANEGKLDPVIGRSKEIRAVMEILGRRSKNNPVLVGPAGVGKTAIVEGLAFAIQKGEVPDTLAGKTIYSLDLGSLMAGTKFRGEFEERLQSLLKFIKQSAGESLLFIDEIHQLVGAGKTDGAMDAANLLKPALARGELNCIGATTYEEYQKYILGDGALDRRFRSVPVKEPTKEDAVEIMMGVREKLEIHHGIKISDEAIFSSVFLSDQYVTDKNLPDKSIDLVDEAASALKLSSLAMPASLVELEGEIRSKKIYFQLNKNSDLEQEIAELEKRFAVDKENWEKEVLSVKRVSELKNQLEKYKFELESAQRSQDFERASELKYSVIPEVEKQLAGTNHDWVLSTKDIANVISRQTGIPIEKILKDKQDHILELEGFLKGQVFGQDEALHEVAETLVTSHSGLSDPSRPLGSFLLKGPSGVGKTETAKAISRFLFDNEKNLIRIDMSEFSEKHSVSKLIGSPAGYVGYEEGGILTEAVRRMPYAIILFDEIEKAHRDFSDILLQILDDGRLTDNKGRTIDFKNTIIFMTTNSTSVETDFKPEVLGRIDGILEYRSLDASIMQNLIEKQVALLNERLVDKSLTVKIGAALEKRLSNLGYDERYGARPLQSVFNKEVIRPLSKKLLQGNFEEKNSLLIDLGADDQLTIN